MGDNQVIQIKNQLVGFEANLGGCDKTALIVGIVCLTCLLIITKCGIITYCGARMLRVRKKRDEEKARKEERFKEMECELEGLSKQRKRDEDMRMEQRMKCEESWK